MTSTEGDKSLVERLHAATAHGDQEHRDWLLAAYTAFFAGEPVPAPRGSGRKEKLIRSLAAEVAMLKEALTKLRTEIERRRIRAPVTEYGRGWNCGLEETDDLVAALQQPALTKEV